MSKKLDSRRLTALKALESQIKSLREKEDKPEWVAKKIEQKEQERKSLLEKLPNMPTTFSGA